MQLVYLTFNYNTDFGFLNITLDVSMIMYQFLMFMKTKTDQHATYNTLKSVPTLPR